MFLIVGNSHDDILFYETSLKNIREEREETSNFAKLLFTIVLAILCAVVLCVIVFENSFLLNQHLFLYLFQYFSMVLLHDKKEFLFYHM